MPETQLLAFHWETRYGPVEGRLPVPTRPMRLAELAHGAYQMSGRLVNMAVAASEAEGKRIACGPNCGACCRQAVPLSLPEAFFLYEMVAGLPLERRRQVLERFELVQNGIQKAGLDQQSLSRASLEEIEKVGLAYFRMGLPCPFLENESCSIHPIRPTVCREFLVTSSPEHCAEPDRPGVVGLPMGIHLTEALAKVAATVLGGDPELIPMPLALGHAAERQEEAKKVFDSLQLMGLFLQCAGETAD